ncbi:MAG: VOC family protein [Brooklawnia sp.]|jgi:predicted enzyme related to lactoylglutathione lyase
MAHGDITHIDIPVSNQDVSKQFYSTLFGWKFQEFPGFEGYPMWQAPNQISGGGLAGPEMGLDRVRSYVEVDSIDEVLAKVAENGGEVVTGKTPISDTSWFAVFNDPDGNQLGLYEGTTSTE